MRIEKAARGYAVEGRSNVVEKVIVRRKDKQDGQIFKPPFFPRKLTPVFRGVCAHEIERDRPDSLPPICVCACKGVEERKRHRGKIEKREDKNPFLPAGTERIIYDIQKRDHKEQSEIEQHVPAVFGACVVDDAAEKAVQRKLFAEVKVTVKHIER